MAQSNAAVFDRTMRRQTILTAILAERRSQDAKWGWPASQAEADALVGRHLAGLNVDGKNTILGEEVGEVANAILEGDDDNLAVELIQVAAVCVARITNGVRTMTDHRTKPHIYVAGPYTSPYPIYNMRSALEAANRLIEAGFGHPIVPHLTGFWDFAYPQPYEFWLDLDLEGMRSCDAVWRIAGKSSGADGEVANADELGIPVFTEFEALELWCSEWSNA